MMTSRLARLTSIFSLLLVLVGGVYSEVVEGCYGPPEPCLERTLSCGDGNVIMMTSDSRGGSARFGTKGYNCTRSQENQCNSICCIFEESENDTQTSWTGRDLLSVYQNCTNQRSCNLTPVYRSNTTFQSVYYSYSCRKENAVHNLFDLTAKSLTNESFIYYSGEDQPKDTSCSCEVNNIQIGDTLEVYFRDLTVDTCKKIKIFPQEKILLNCSVGYNSPETVNLNNGSRVQFDDLVFKSHEFVLFKLTVNQGFRNLSCVCSGGLPAINASTNEKEFQYTGLMIGLIVAALMIIVGVVLFCYWRKRTEQTEVVTVHTRKRRSTLMDIYNQEANRQSTASTTKQEPSRQSTTSTTNQEPNRQSITSKTNQGFTADKTDSVKVTTARSTSESHNDDDGLIEVPLRNSNNSRKSGGSHSYDDTYLKPQEVQAEMPLRNSNNSRKSGKSSLGEDDELDADDYKIPPAPRKLESESDPATAHGDAAGGDDGDHGSNQDIYVNTKNLDQNPDEDDNYVVPCENPDFYIDMDHPTASTPQIRVTTADPSDDLYENVEKEPGDDGALDIYEEMDNVNH